MNPLASARPWSPLLGLVAAGALAACGGAPAGKPGKSVIQNKGSDTMVNVAQVWAEEYRKAAPDVEVEVSESVEEVERNRDLVSHTGLEPTPVTRRRAFRSRRRS